MLVIKKLQLIKGCLHNMCIKSSMFYMWSYMVLLKLLSYLAESFLIYWKVPAIDVFTTIYISLSCIKCFILWLCPSDADLSSTLAHFVYLPILISRYHPFHFLLQTCYSYMEFCSIMLHCKRFAISV